MYFLRFLLIQLTMLVSHIGCVAVCFNYQRYIHSKNSETN